MTKDGSLIKDCLTAISESNAANLFKENDVITEHPLDDDIVKMIISRLGKHQFATRKTVIRIKERTNSQRGTHQFTRGTHLQMAT